MGFDSQILIELNQLFRDKKYEYNDLNDGTGVIVSIETGKIITLNGMGNLVIAEIAQQTESDTRGDSLSKIAQTESDKHAVPVENVEADIGSFLSNLVMAIRKH